MTLIFGLQVPRVPHWSTSQGTLPLLDFGKSEHNISFGYWDGAFCHKKGFLRGNLLTFPLFCHKKRSQRGRNRLPPAFCHKFALFRGKLPHFSSFCRKKGTLCGNLPFRLCRRQGCVRDSRFRRAASVLDVPFAAELAILAATHLKSLTQSSQFASRTGASASSGYFALLKVSPVRILSAIEP